MRRAYNYNNYRGITLLPHSGKIYTTILEQSTDLPAVQITTRRRDEVHGGDETLKRRETEKFTEGDMSGAVTELASAEGLSTAGWRYS